MTKNELEDFERRISLIFHGSIALTLLPFVLLYLEFTHDNLQPFYTGYWFLDPVMLLAAAIIVFVGFRNYRSHLTEIPPGASLDRKFEHLFRIYLGFYLRIFLASTLLVFAYWLTGALGVVIGYVVILFLLSLHRPTRMRFVRDMPVTGAEKDFILQKNGGDE